MLRAQMVPIFQQVIATQDRYGLQAYLTALENAGLRGKLEVELQTGSTMSEDEKNTLWKILQAGVLLPGEPAMRESGATTAWLS